MGVSEPLLFLFLRAAAGGAQEMRTLGHSPKPQVKGCRPSRSYLNRRQTGYPYYTTVVPSGAFVLWSSSHARGRAELVPRISSQH